MDRAVSNFKGFQRILVATDFSPSSEAAVKQALWLAGRSNATITLAHALPDPGTDMHTDATQVGMELVCGESSVFEREVRRASDARMRRMIEKLSAADLGVMYKTLLGAPFTEITHAVLQEGYDLVLVGTRGLAAWQQFFTGSTVKRLIRKCPSSVWTVKAEPVGPPRSILATTDFSEVSRCAVLEGLWVAQQAQASFHLLHVIDSADVPEDIISRIPAGGSLRHEINEEAKRRFDEFAASLNIDRDQIQRHLSFGTPWQEIGRLASHLNVDLIALGTVGRSGIMGVLLGNTAEKVLDTCDCSLLTVKPGNFVPPVIPPSRPLHPEPSEAASMTEPPFGNESLKG